MPEPLRNIPLSIRIAASAQARQQGLNREEYRQLCQRLLRETVQTQTHGLDRYFGNSARSTSANFQRAGIGEAYRNAGQLRPGDLVYSNQGDPHYGHAMVVGPDGQLYDQVGHGAPQPSGFRAPNWIVHPDQAIANYNTARDSGQNHQQAIARTTAPPLPTQSTPEPNAPSLFQATRYQTPTGRNQTPPSDTPPGGGLQAMMGDPVFAQSASQPPSNWELGPTMGAYSDQNFNLGPSTFLNPTTGQMISGQQGGSGYFGASDLPPAPSASPYNNYNPSVMSNTGSGDPFLSNVWQNSNYTAPESGERQSNYFRPDSSVYPTSGEGGTDIVNFGNDPGSDTISLGEDLPSYTGPSGQPAGASGQPSAEPRTRQTTPRRQTNDFQYQGTVGPIYDVQYASNVVPYNYGGATSNPYGGQAGVGPTLPGSNYFQLVQAAQAGVPGASSSLAHGFGQMVAGSYSENATAGVSTLLTPEGMGDYAMSGRQHPNNPAYWQYHTPHPSGASLRNAALEYGPVRYGTPRTASERNFQHAG